MRSDRAWPFLTAAIAGLAYLATPSSFYNFDGVACAIAVELGELSRLAHGNHLAYGLLGLAFDRAWRLLGYQGQAILSLQVLDSLLGGLGAGLFCRLLTRRLACPAAMAAAASLGLAFSYAYWLWSLEAQVYLLGAVFLILAADEALAHSPRPWLVGLWQAGAVLGHVGHLMFAPAAVWLLWDAPRRRTALLRYAAVLAGGVAAAYILAGLFCVRPRSLAELRLWLLGSAALKLGGAFHWQTGPSMAQNLSDWLFMTLRIFSDATVLSGWPRTLAWAFSAAAVAAAAAGARPFSRPARAALLWLAGYFPLFVSWQPHTMVYRISDLMPLWLLITLAARQSRARIAGLGGAVACLAVFNLAYLILPQTNPLRNTAYQEALSIRKLLPEEAWVVVSGRDQVYVPYFGRRKPLNMRYLREPGRLEERLDRLDASGEPVFVPISLLNEDASLRRRLEDYGLKESVREGGLVLYQATKGNPNGRRKKKLNTAPALRKGPKGIGSDLLRAPRAIRETP